MTTRAPMWEPNPEWPPEVQRFVAGLGVYLLSLPPAERQQVVRDIGIRMMESALPENTDPRGGGQ